MQDHRHGPAGRRVVDMDGQKAALIIMGIEQRQLLVAMDDVDSVVDVERHRLGWVGTALTVDVDHGPHQPDDLTQGGRVLPTRDGRLRAQIRSAVGQPISGELEAGV